jgi:putative ABC transport system permease protein
MRTFLTILGTSIGIATVVFLISLGYGLQYILLGKLITSEDSLITINASYPQEAGLSIKQEKIDEIAVLPMVGELSATTEFSGEIKDQATTGLLLVRMISPSFFRLSGVIPNVGRGFNDNEAGAILTSQAVKILAFNTNEESLGQSVTVNANYTDPDGSNPQEVVGKQDFKVVGVIVDDLEPPAIYVPISFFPPPPFYKDLYVKATGIDQVTALRDALVTKGYIISAKIDLINQASKILTIITIVLGVFGIAALLVSAVGMFNTMIVSFLERTYEVGVMKSLGATDGDIRNLFYMESLIMGLAGGVAGIALGWGLGQIVNLGINILSKHLGGGSFQLFITPLWFIGVIIVSSAFIGLFAGFWPAKRATGLSPKEAFLRK